MASDAGEYDDEYERESVAAEDALLTERLDEARLLSESASNDTQELAIRDNECTAQDGSAAATATQQQLSGWSTERSASTDTAQVATDSTATLRHAVPAQPQRRCKLNKEQQQIQSLTRQLSQSKKLIADLRQQLQVFYKNEAVAQLENKNRAKQLEIDELQHENRMLQHQQRLLAKQIDELQSAKAQKKQALLDDLRACKERLRQSKETQRDVDDKAVRMHQHTVDLATKNKALVERVKTLEVAATLASQPSTASFQTAPVLSARTVSSASSVMDTEAIIASQEDEITRLQQRVELMKRAHRAERSKQDRRLQASRDDVEQTRTQLDAFHETLFAKEKTIRSLYLQLKKLKRAVQDLTHAQQTNEHMQNMVFGSGVRVLGHSPRSHHHQHQQQSQRHSPTHYHSASTSSLPPAMTKRLSTHRIHDTLRQLGYVPTFSKASPSSHKPSDIRRELSGHTSSAHAVAYESDANDDEHELLPSHGIQGRLVPGPPPASGDRKAVSSGARTPRSHVYATVAPLSPVVRRHEQSSSDPMTHMSFDKGEGSVVVDDTEAAEDSGMRARGDESDADAEEQGDSDGDTHSHDDSER